MEYQTIVSEYVNYGRNKFLEISKKKVKPDDTVFLNISKGFYTPEGEKRYQRGIGFPNEKDVVENLIEKLKVIASQEPIATDAPLVETPATQGPKATEPGLIEEGVMSEDV